MNANYKIETIEKGGKTSHIVVQYDFETGIEMRQVCSDEVYGYLNDSKKKQANMKRSDRRHIDWSRLEEEEIHSNSASVEQSVEQRELSKRLNSHLKKLSFMEETRVRAYFGGKSMTDIAKEEGCSVAAISKSIHAALPKLKTMLNKDGYYHS